MYICKHASKRLTGSAYIKKTLRVLWTSPISGRVHSRAHVLGGYGGGGDKVSLSRCGTFKALCCSGPDTSKRLLLSVLAGSKKKRRCAFFFLIAPTLLPALDVGRTSPRLPRLQMNCGGCSRLLPLALYKTLSMMHYA